ncbi:hypothetical protein ES705_06015 [subsurface metagenome]
MKEFIFSFNFAGYITTGVKNIAEKTLTLNGFNMYTQDLEYPTLLNAIKKKNGQEIEINSIKYLQIQHSNIYTHSPINHLLVSFRLKWETYTNEMFDELQNNMETIFNTIKDYNKIYYFNTNLFVDFQISSFIDDYISSELMDEELNVGPAYRIQRTGFFIIFVSFIHKNYSEIISKAIKSYLDNEFPNIMGTTALNVNEIKLHHLSEGNFKNLESYLSVELLPFLSRQISNYNINIVYILQTFQRILFDMQTSIENYDYSGLIKLERYFNEIRNNLDSKYVLFPNMEYGILFLTKNPTKLTELNQESLLYKKNLLQLHKVHYQDFQLYRTNLKTELNRIMSIIRYLVNQKRETIKRYSKLDLEHKLSNIPNEEVFRQLIKEILEDLGFQDIEYTHGTEEMGKDIVFSNRNKFKMKEWNAIVAKVGKIKTDDARKLPDKIKLLIYQVEEAYAFKYEDDKGSKHFITRVFIATNESITKDAKKRIRKKLKGNVFFIEKDTLLDLC